MVHQPALPARNEGGIDQDRPARVQESFGEIGQMAVGAAGEIAAVDALLSTPTPVRASASSPARRLRSTSERRQMAPRGSRTPWLNVVLPEPDKPWVMRSGVDAAG